MKKIYGIVLLMGLLPSIVSASLPVPLVDFSSVDACNRTMEQWQKYTSETSYGNSEWFFYLARDPYTDDEALRVLYYLNGITYIGFGSGSLCSAFGNLTSVYDNYSGDSFPVSPEFWPTIRNLVLPIIEKAMTDVMNNPPHHYLHLKEVRIMVSCELNHGQTITSKQCSIYLK